MIKRMCDNCGDEMPVETPRGLTPCMCVPLKSETVKAHVQVFLAGKVDVCLKCIVATITEAGP